MQAITKQLLFELEHFQVNKKTIETLFIGGGTPSTVSAKLYEPIFERLAPYLKEDAEVTIEANPNSATSTWLNDMQTLGMNRVSLGVQSFNETKLKALGRAHTQKEAIRAIEQAHHIGLKHISLDLIYNYQGDTKTLLESDITQALQLPIDHISAYELTIENNTKFHATPEVRQESDTLAYFVTDTITSHGFEQYEISNFGTYKSKHNLGYWQQKNYMGIGAGAVGFLNHTRFYPTTHIENYIANPLARKQETLTPKDILTEAIFLGLRSQVGIQKSLLSTTMLQKAKLLVAEKKLTETPTHFYNKNYFLSDEIALYLL
jgi:oxygen-independent coproporphyrinogen-3 oxidase